MENIKEIKKRINGKDKVKENRLIKFFNFFFAMMIILLGGLIYCKTDENGALFEKIFHRKISFKDFNQTIDNYLSKLFFFNKQTQNDIEVGGMDIYQSLGNNMYTTTDKTIRAIREGEVLSKSYQDEYRYFVVVKYDNNVKALYTLIDQVDVELNQTFSSNQIIGSYEGSYFQCIFTKEDKVISYQDAIK